MPNGYGDFTEEPENAAMWGKKIKEAREAEKDLTLEKLSEEVGISISQLSRFESEQRVPRLDEIVRIAKRLGLRASDLLGETPPMVPIVGHVRAGADDITYSDGDAPSELVEAPPESTDTTVAVIVRGVSMSGRVDDGDIVYYDARENGIRDEMNGRLCVIGLADGRVVLKKTQVINGVWVLLSTNADPIIDPDIEWSARVIWIKPR